MGSIYHQASFTQSASAFSNLPEELGFEVAFAGRSNSGKSSTINRLCNQKSLARTSKTPGRTQLINFFALPEGRFLVDLPGYGYAKVPEQIKKQWQSLMQDYLTQRWTLKGLVIVMDVRHPFKPNDWVMIDWARKKGVSVHIILNKVDKLKRGAAKQAFFSAEKLLNDKVGEGGCSIQLFSAGSGAGLEQLEGKLDIWLGLTE